MVGRASRDCRCTSSSCPGNFTDGPCQLFRSVDTVKRLNPSSSTTRTSRTSKTSSGAAEQGELFSLYLYHCVFTDSPLTLVQAETDHRGQAIIEQVHADLRSGPLAHFCVRIVPGEQCLAGPGDDRVQPDPRRRDPGLALPRPSHHRLDPHPADRRPRPARPLRPPAHHAPARALALAARLAAAVPRHPRPDLTDHPAPTTGPQWKRRAHRQHPAARDRQHHHPRSRIGVSQDHTTARCIQA